MTSYCFAGGGRGEGEGIESDTLCALRGKLCPPFVSEVPTRISRLARHLHNKVQGLAVSPRVPSDLYSSPMRLMVDRQ